MHGERKERRVPKAGSAAAAVKEEERSNNFPVAALPSLPLSLFEMETTVTSGHMLRLFTQPPLPRLPSFTVCDE